MAGILSKGIKLQYKNGASYADIPGLIEIPDLGGDVEKVEVTTLADGAKAYIRGIKDYGDLEFKFLYDNSTANSNYRVLKGLETSGAVTDFKVVFPDNTEFTFKAQVATKIDGVGVNAPLTFVAILILNSDITVSNPA